MKLGTQNQQLATSNQQLQKRRAFTLIEIIIAVTIFGIISIAVYSTFRVGLSSYEAGREQMVVTQTARVFFDLLARDVRAIYYLPPSAYNRNLIGQLQFRAMKKMQAPQMPGTRIARRGRPPPAERRAGEARSADGDEEEEPLSGIPIDLTIVGVDGEQGDSFTFACYQVHWGTAPVEPWALARVKYFVEDGNLFRAEGPVAVEEVPSFQWQPPPPPESDNRREDDREPEAPQKPQDADHYLEGAPRELVARNVKFFDLHYGYWTDEGWFEASDWIAHERRHRNPPQELDPFDPNDQRIAQFNRSRPYDDIPAYVAVTLGLGYGRNNSGTRLFRSRIRLLNSLETYEPFVDSTLAMGAEQPRAPVPPATPFGMPGGPRPRW